MKTCPICRSKSEKTVLSKVHLIMDLDHDLVACDKCGVIYFDPLPSLEELSDFYSASYFSHFVGWRDEVSGDMYSKKLKRIKDSGNFLDVGCAAGYFIYGINKKSDWNVYGVEYSKEAVDYAKEKLNLDVRQGELVDANYPDKFFDYIHLNNVLEHVSEPVKLLDECRRILKPDGYFFVSVPNGLNDSRNLVEYYLLEHESPRSFSGHIFFFPGETLINMFDKAGFNIESKKSGSIKRGLRNIGWLPKKKNWKNSYIPRRIEKNPAKEDVSPIVKKQLPEIYYKYKFFEGRLRNIPGLYKFGLDYQFVLKRKK